MELAGVQKRLCNVYKIKCNPPPEYGPATAEFKDSQTQFANAINILNIGVGVLDGRHFFSANVLSSVKVTEHLILFLFCRLEPCS